MASIPELQFDVEAATADLRAMLAALNDLFTACREIDIPAETKVKMASLAIDLVDVAMTGLKVTIRPSDRHE